MKTQIKIFLPLIFLLLLLQPEAKAQDGWNFGLKGGLNMSWISTPEVSGDPLPGTFGTRTSYNVGLLAEMTKVGRASTAYQLSNFNNQIQTSTSSIYRNC